MPPKTGPDPGPNAAGKPLFGFAPPRVRRALWWGYAAALAVYAASRLVPLPPSAASTLPTGFVVAVTFLAFAAMSGASFHSAGLERLFWGLGSACVALPAMALAAELATGLRAPSNAAATAALLLAALDASAVVAMVVLLVAFSKFRHASWAARARYTIDVLAVGIVAVGVLEFWVIGPWVDRVAPGPWWVRFVFSETPVLGVLIVVGTLATVFGTRFDRWETWERLLAGAVAALSVGLLLTPLTYADGVSHVAGGWAVALTEAVWLTAAYLGLSGAVTRHLGAAREWRIRPLEILEPSYGWFPIVALPVAEALALPLLGYAALQPADPGARMLRIAATGVVALTIAVRTLLTVMDADELTAGVATDPLTGLYNHRHFQQRLAGEVASASRFGESVSLIALDVDDFARVNAAGGHAVGDATLAGVARAVDRGVRTRDVVCRLGGDELAVILPGADADAAFSIGERILAEIRSVSAPGGRWVTASAGVASLRGTAADRAELLKGAEAALYQAKRLGKDCAVLFCDDGAAALSAEDRVRLLRQRTDHATVSALAAAVDARDEATQDHSRNVARYAVALGRDLCLAEPDMDRIEYAALLHDVGKIGIPDALLRKSGELTADERARMEAHAVVGEQILESTTMREILPLVRHHHERWDGTGYPDGLVGDEIPLGARVLALANAYDALRSNRPNRAALSRTAALQELDLGLGSKFDPVLGERFIAEIARDYL